MTPLTLQEFADALRKGLGRAVLHLKAYGASGLQDTLLDACLHELSYDPQLEESRADWLMLLLEHVPDAAWYRDRLLDTLPTLTSLGDVEQGLKLALRFAQRGDRAARDVLYRFVGRRYERRRVGLDEVVELDGIPGLLHAAAVIGTQYREDPGAWDSDSWWLSESCERLGQDEVWSALRAEAAVDPRIAAFLEAGRAEESGTTEPPGSHLPRPWTR